MRLGPGARRLTGEVGDTLVELLVTVVIMGVAVSALVGGLAAVLGSSGTHRKATNLDSIVQSFAETVRDAVELVPAGTRSTPLFTACAPSYLVASAPYPAQGPGGTATTGMAITVFASGFTGGGSTTPTVTFSHTGQPSAQALDVVATPDQSPYGNVVFNFVVPSAAPTGADTVTVSYKGQSATAPVNFTVTSAVAAVNPSPLAGYTMGISSIAYGSGDAAEYGTGSGRAGFTSSCSSPGNGLSQDLQQITVSGATAGAGDSARVIVANPGISKATPGVAVTGTSSGTSVGSTISFSASLTGRASWGAGAWLTSKYQGGLRWTVVGPTQSQTTVCTPANPPLSVSGTTASGSCSFTALTTGSYTATAVYSGDPDNTVAAGTSSAQAVTGKATPTLALTEAPANPAYGQAITFTATVTSSAPLLPAPTGAVTFTSSCPSGSSTLVPGSVTSPATQPAYSTATCTIPSPTPGATYAEQASYAGDPTYSAVPNTPATPVSATSPKLTPTMSVAASPSGTSVVFTATVSAPATSNPAPTGGTVSWTGVTCTPASPTPIAASSPQTTPPSATSTCTVVNAQPAMTYTAQATYGGTNDPNYGSSTTASASYSTAKATPTVTVTGKVDTSKNQVVWTITAAGTGTTAPTGTLNIAAGTPTGTATESCPATSTALVPAKAAGSATATVTCSTGGGVKGTTFSVSASYPGDQNYTSPNPDPTTGSVTQ